MQNSDSSLFHVPEPRMRIAYISDIIDANQILKLPHVNITFRMDELIQSLYPGVTQNDSEQFTIAAVKSALHVYYMYGITHIADIQLEGDPLAKNSFKSLKEVQEDAVQFLNEVCKLDSQTDIFLPPISVSDEAIVDALLAKRTASMKIRPIKQHLFKRMKMWFARVVSFLFMKKPVHLK